MSLPPVLSPPELRICLSISTALSGYRLDQREVAERAVHVFGDRYPRFGRLAESFATAEVDTRHSMVPIAWFSQPHGWENRSRAYVAGAKVMFADAANRALRDAG